MNVALTPQLEAMIREKVASGRYDSADAVMREALRLLDERDRFERAKAAIAAGIEQADRGQVTQWSPDLMRRLRQEADEDERLERPIADDVLPSP
jgi:antitoxin ParD1/3/4